MVKYSELALASGVIVIAATVCGAAGYCVARVMATTETQASQLMVLEKLEEDIHKLAVSNKQILEQSRKQ